MLRFPTNGNLPVVFGLDDCAVGNPCRQHQRHVTGTRRDDGFDLFRRTWDFQQRLKAVGLPRALFLDQSQPLFFVDDVRREDKASNLRGSRQLIERFGLHRQGTWAGFAVQNVLVEFRRVGMRAFDSGNDHLVVLALMLPRQRPHIHPAAVLCQKRRCIF
jgi:hypothetical protein